MRSQKLLLPDENERGDIGNWIFFFWPRFDTRPRFFVRDRGTVRDREIPVAAVAEVGADDVGCEAEGTGDEQERG